MARPSAGTGRALPHRRNKHSGQGAFSPVLLRSRRRDDGRGEAVSSAVSASSRRSTRLRWADRILSDGMVGRCHADPEQKQDFGDRTITPGIDTTGPITEALLWHFYHRTQSEAGAAEWTSQAHDVCQMIKQHAPDGRQGRVRWGSAGLSFSPLWRLANADAVGTGTRSMSSAYAGAGLATSGPRSDQARVLP